MPRIQTLICSGVCFLICSATTAQSIPKKKSSIQQVVSNHEYQQKKWNYNQLPKNSIQFRSDPKYIPLVDKKTSTNGLHLYPVATPEVKKSFSVESPSSHINSRSYLQSSRFLKYEWQKQNPWQTVQFRRINF